MRWRLPVWSLLVIVAPHLAFAQPASQPYEVGPGDSLKVEIAGQDHLSGKMEVRPDGTIDMELLGPIAVAGKSPEEIDVLLTESLAKYLRKPNVTVSIAHYGSQVVYVLGAVKSPGRYTLKDKRHVLDLLMEAGGPSGSPAMLHLVRSTDDDVETRHIQLAGLLVDGDFTNNVLLSSGDILYIPATTQTTSGVLADSDRITVVGEVAQPGLFSLQPGATAMAAVLAAGGLTKYASAKRARVVRNGPDGREILHVDLAAVMKKGRKDKDVRLRPAVEHQVETDHGMGVGRRPKGGGVPRPRDDEAIRLHRCVVRSETFSPHDVLRPSAVTPSASDPHPGV